MNKKRWGSEDRIQLARVMVYDFVCDVMETMPMDDDIIEAEDFEGADDHDVTVHYGWIPIEDTDDDEDDDNYKDDDIVLFVQDHPKFFQYMEEQTHLREIYRAMVTGQLNEKHVLLMPPS